MSDIETYYSDMSRELLIDEFISTTERSTVLMTSYIVNLMERVKSLETEKDKQKERIDTLRKGNETLRSDIKKIRDEIRGMKDSDAD